MRDVGDPIVEDVPGMDTSDLDEAVFRDDVVHEIEITLGGDAWSALDADPYELENIAATASANLLAGLSALVRDLTSCSGADCRAAEETAPP